MKLPHCAQLTVLVIEDDEVDRESVHRMLGHDYDVIDASSGADALALLRDRDPDCVLLDYRLPDGTGLSLLRKLVRRGLPVVMMTSQGNEKIAVDAMKLGAQEYLVKGDRSRPLLVRTITSAIGRAALHTELARQRRELEEFVHTAANDIKGPLHSIVRFCETISADLDLGKTQRARDDVILIGESASRLANLVGSLLDYTRYGSEPARLVPVDLGTLIDDLIGEMRESLQATGGRVEAGPLPVVAGEPALLSQLLQNLLDNALKFRNNEPPLVRIAAEREGERWRVSVTDNGIGIGAEQQAVIFKPLHRLNLTENVTGHGLGLAICERIVEKLSGTIEVESTPGKGATFSFTLPMVS